eukprot:354028-Chlamydomonas_euryale.AAC.2
MCAGWCARSGCRGHSRHRPPGKLVSATNLSNLINPPPPPSPHTHTHTGPPQRHAGGATAPPSPPLRPAREARARYAGAKPLGERVRRDWHQVRRLHHTAREAAGADDGKGIV